jgi:hypothetical protein
MSDWDDDLPEFQTRKPYIVNTYITQVLSMSGGSALLKLISYDDNSYRAIFKSTFFTLQEGQTEPSKSQWSTLKKRMKRRDRHTFVFRKYGEADCRDAGDNVPATRDYDCLYIDFGFFAD